MAAPKGNKYALGNNGGRPPIVAPDDRKALGEKMVADFQAHLDDFDNNKSPIFIEAWARQNNISDDTLRRYCDEDKEFCVSYKQCKQIQKELLIRGGLKGYFNPTAFIFTAKNITDMRDHQDVDVTSLGKQLGTFTDEQIAKIAGRILNGGAKSEK